MGVRIIIIIIIIIRQQATRRVCLELYYAGGGDTRPPRCFVSGSTAPGMGWTHANFMHAVLSRAQRSRLVPWKTQLA